jgi:anti-sigma regulatory factor (Ser/Thr protein kinase)
MARRHVAQLFGELRGDAVDTLVLLVSELVANAVEHGRGPLHLMLDSVDGRVRMEIQDGSHSTPTPQDAGLLAEGGRGLMIVQSLADAWGVREVSGGMSVWFELDTRRRGE